jgi:uncharacterized delta-60 repeat protein
VAIDSAGRIVLAGRVSNNTNNSGNFAVARLTPNGSLDTSFAASGKAITDVAPGLDDYAYSLVLQSDDKIVLAGYAEASDNLNQVALVRYNVNGSLDTTFDGDGRLLVSITSKTSQRALDSALQPDGKLVTLAGAGNDWRVARFQMGNAPVSRSATLNVTDNDTANITINDVSLAEGSPSGTTAFTFTVSLGLPVASNVTVDFATANGTATTADNDYTAAGGTLTFTAGGALTQTVTVYVNKDSKVESDETFYVNLSNAKFGGVTDAARAAITDSQGKGTIWNDDALPGDANLDGTVNGADLNTVLSNYNQTGMNWSQGDFNGDGAVNGADLNIVLSNYNQSTGLSAAQVSPPAAAIARVENQADRTDASPIQVGD